MGNTVYGFKETDKGPLITVTADAEHIKSAHEYELRFEAFLLEGMKMGTVVAEENSANMSFTFDFKKAWLKRLEQRRHRSLTVAKAALVTLVNTGYDDPEDPKFFAKLGSPISDGRLSMMVEFPWPTVPEEQITQVATKYMRSIATDLRYPNPDNPGYNRRQIPQLVYAHFDRNHGAELQTNPIGSCSIGTDGSMYYSSDSVLEMGAHNIYSRDQQIICLAGAIAAANAEKILSMTDSAE